MKPDEVLSGFREQCESFKTLTGRVRVYGKTSSETFSFPAEIAINFKGGATLRLAAEGPLGTTPALLLFKNTALEFLDFERRERLSFKEKWNGIPVGWMPSLFVGCPADIDKQKALQWDGDVLESELDGLHLKYESRWFSDLEKPGIASISSDKIGSEKIDYSVRFSDFAAVSERRLPREIEIKSNLMYLRINWLERHFEKDIPDTVFTLPKIDF